jgi:hypothetical protein
MFVVHNFAKRILYFKAINSKASPFINRPSVSQKCQHIDFIKEKTKLCKNDFVVHIFLPNDRMLPLKIKHYPRVNLAFPHKLTPT